MCELLYFGYKMLWQENTFSKVLWIIMYLAHLFTEESKEFGSGLGVLVFLYEAKVTERGPGEILHVWKKSKMECILFSLNIEERSLIYVCIEVRNRVFQCWLRVQVVSSEASGMGCWSLRHATRLDRKQEQSKMTITSRFSAIII